MLEVLPFIFLFVVVATPVIILIKYFNRKRFNKEQYEKYKEWKKKYDSGNRYN